MPSAGFGAAYRHLQRLFRTGSVAGLEDGQLLSRYEADRDEAAFEALIDRHGPMVLTICQAVLRNEHDVEDAFQATFVVLARKAGSIRSSETLAGWLHRVAYRASVQAGSEVRRRRRKEAEVSLMRTLETSPTGSDPELVEILHEEINRLPDRHRLAVVLCDLEGLTYEQAARHLRWTVPSLRNRLARARQKLKSRLTRRGVMVPMVAGLMTSKATAALPPLLARTTLSAATGGPTRAVVTLLTHTLLRKMLMTQIKMASTITLATIALAWAGWMATGAGRLEGPQPALKPEDEAKVEVLARDEPAAARPVELVEVKGRVVAPDGKPVAGAAVRGTYFVRNSQSFPSATSGPDGRFTISLPKPKGAAGEEGYSGRYPWLVASASGYGVGWTERVLRADRPAEQRVTLVEDGPPIEGRIVDLEGRPVVGASVDATRIWFEEKGDLAGWIAKARNGAMGNLWQGLANLPLGSPTTPKQPDSSERVVSIATRTGPDGRFRLTGIGRDRIAALSVSGTGIATTEIHVFSRSEPEIRTIDKGMTRMREPFVVEAPRFQIALTPAKRVGGVVRDKDSGKPIAGIEIQAAVFDERSLIPAPGIQARTDLEGRYVLEGLPKAAAYRLFLRPDPGLPYLNGTFKAPADSPGLEPVVFDLALKRGVLVRGKVTDKVTGRPIQGHASYYSMSDNPHVDDYPGFSQSYEQQANLDEQGRYEAIALPGRGLIAVRDESDRYRPASGYMAIQGYNAEGRYFSTRPHILSPGGYAIVAEVVAGPKAEAITLDLQADPGKSVAVEVVGPEGAPIGETKVKGLRQLFQTGPVPQPSSSFEVTALDSSQPRRVVVMHEGRKLIGSTLLKGDEVGPVAIKLVPWGSVAGRIVNDEGRPRKGMFIGSPDGSTNAHPETHDILPWSDWNQGIRVGDDGRFLVEGLVPGLKYDANTRSGLEAFGSLFRDVIVAPGEVKDLGDLKVQPAQPKAQ